MLPTLLYQARQVNGQYAIVKGLVGLRELPLGLQLSDHLDDDLGPFPIDAPMQRGWSNSNNRCCTAAICS
jgi:hypothetical protein